jgi:hypothetical protein
MPRAGRRLSGFAIEVFWLAGCSPSHLLLVIKNHYGNQTTPVKTRRRRKIGALDLLRLFTLALYRLLL